MALKEKPDKLTASTARAAPALEKGLEVLELLNRSEAPLSQKEIAEELGRSVGELYRMVLCLTERGYIVNVDDRFSVTTKLFELAHVNPPTARLLAAAEPIMHKLASDLEQSCHLTIYNHGRQLVVAKVDGPSGVGFSVRVGAELDVLVSASGRVLLAFQDDETRAMRVGETKVAQQGFEIEEILDAVRDRGFESIPSGQVRGLHAVSFPVLNAGGHAMAALTVPYTDRIDQAAQLPVPAIEDALGVAAKALSNRMGGCAHFASDSPAPLESAPKQR